MHQALATFPKVEAISIWVAWSANTAFLNAVALFSLPILLVFSTSKQGGLVFEISKKGQVSWRSVLE
jgi:hypothetical protein